MLRRLSFQLMFAITITLVLMLGANLYMVWQKQHRDLLAQMHANAQVIAQQLISTRLFIARNQDRINRDHLGHYEFKGLNPAAVGRGVGKILYARTGVRVKQTRSQPRRPENQPDAFEQEALARFAADPSLREFWKQMQENGQPVFRYAVPLRVEQECLQCHGGPPEEKDIAGYPKEGLREGDLGGAISVSLPMGEAMATIRRNALTQVWMIILVTGVSLLVIYLVSRYLVTDPLERLAAVAASIGAGRLAVRREELALLHRSRELGVVADSIEGMARSLRELYEGLEEKVRERTRELEQANRLQSQFLATVSHELRTPLTSIIAFTELLLKQANQQQREYLEDVLDASRRLLGMVDNLLDLSRLEAGRLELFTDVVDLPELLKDVERPMRHLAEKKEIAMTFEPMAGLPPVMVDPLRVKQVMMNLVGNAIKFTPEGGQIRVSAHERPGWVEVRVRDTGPGVAPEDRTVIFEAFRRAEVRGQNHPGTGLGLALCRSLIELHGGRIWVEDAPGGGSVFCFTLPVAQIEVAEEERPHGADQADPGGR